MNLNICVAFKHNHWLYLRHIIPENTLFDIMKISLKEMKVGSTWIYFVGIYEKYISFFGHTQANKDKALQEFFETKENGEKN